MSLSFQCPSCKRVLQYEGGDSLFQICRHCKGKIIVPSQVIHQQQDEQKARQRITPEQHQLNPKLAHIQQELKTGSKINAIKIFREAYGTDLRTAKEAIETMQFGGELPEVKNAVKPASQIYQGKSTLPTTTAVGSAAGKVIWVLVRIVFFAAIAYWFFN